LPIIRPTQSFGIGRRKDWVELTSKLGGPVFVDMDWSSKKFEANKLAV
jgi:hypothetical protein